MENQIASDANGTAGTADVRDAGISSVLGDVAEPRSATADIIPIVDDEPGKVAEAKAGEEPEKKEGTGDDKTVQKGEGDDDRFDKHPRFQELIQGRKQDSEMISTLKAQVETLTSIVGGKEPPKKEGASEAPDEDKPSIPYKDITQMSKEELLEWQEDDPKAYAANLYAQMLHETRMQIKREQTEAAQKTEQTTRQETVKKTYQQYTEKNPDFNEMWKSGEIQKFMDANPGHNAISAHMAMTSEKRIQAAVEKAVKEAEERVVKNFQAKRNAGVLDGGPGRTPAPDIDPELKNTKESGGLMHVLAKKLNAMRTVGSA